MTYERFSLTDTKPTALKIRRLPHGGYLVSKVGSQAYTQDELFACTDIDDALAFIKDEIGEPEKVAPRPTAAEIKEAQRAINEINSPPYEGIV